MLLEGKYKISILCEFSILSYTQDRQLANLGKCSFTSNFHSSCRLSCKNDKNLTETKAPRSRYAFRRKIKNLQSFPVFHFLLYQNRKLRNLVKFFFISNFDRRWNLRFRKVKICFQKKSENSGGFRIFNFELYQNRELGNVGKCYFTSNFDSNCNLRCKKHKKLTQAKT